MTLTSLRLQGVKGFHEQQEVGIHDIGLLFGANSSGKSSILQTLLVLRSSVALDSGISEPYLKFRSSDNDLGGFTTFVSDHSLEGRIKIGIRLESENGLSEFFSHSKVDVDFEFVATSERSRGRLDALSVTDEHGKTNFNWSGEERSYRIDREGAEAVVSRWVKHLTVAKEQGRRGLAMPGADHLKKLKKWLSEHPAENEDSWVPSWPSTSFGPGVHGKPFGGALNSVPQAQLADLAWFWRFAARRLFGTIVARLEEIEYVGPLREAPRRIATGDSEGRGMGSRGEGLMLHISRSAEIVCDINRAFESLGIDYTLKAQTLEVEGISDALGEVGVLTVTERSSDLVMSPADIGFGVSQVLPVITQLVSQRGKLIVIEQPEVHLHPRQQSRLADLILQSVLVRQNRVLVETHSDHLLNRVLRRVREKPELSSRIGVFHVRREENSAVVDRFELDRNGRMKEPWPADFLEESINDIFSGM